MKINFLKNWSLLSLLFLFVIAVSSCTKEDIEEPPSSDIDPQVVEDVINRNDLGAFDPILGFEDCDCFGPLDSIDWENGDPEVIMEEVEAYLSSLTEEELIALFTPVCTETDFYPNACFAECEGVTDYDVCEGTEWGCEGENIDILECYELIYPVTGVFSDGTTVTFDSPEDYFDAVITAEEEPQLVYPFQVQTIAELGNIEIITVETEEQLINLGVDCYGFGDWDPQGGGHENECFYQDFPFTFIVNGEESVIANDLEFEEFFIEIFENNENPEELDIELGYPVHVIHIETGESYSANSEEEYFELILAQCN